MIEYIVYPELSVYICIYIYIMYYYCLRKKLVRKSLGSQEVGPGVPDSEALRLVPGGFIQGGCKKKKHTKSATRNLITNNFKSEIPIFVTKTIW